MLIEAKPQDIAQLASGCAPAALTAAEGIAEPEILSLLAALAADISRSFTPAAWWVVDSREIVGLCSLKSAPSASGTVEIGYGIAASRQRRGFARRAVTELVAWAQAQSLELSAETTVDNVASQRVLEANGFTRAGERYDAEDGDMICWRIERSRQEGLLCPAKSI